MLNLNVKGLLKLINENQGNLNIVLDLINISKCLADGEENEIIEVLEQVGIEARICSTCKRIMLNGYCIENGMNYACSEDCLHHFMTDEEFNEAFNDGEGDTYITDWTELNSEGIMLGGNIHELL